MAFALFPRHVFLQAQGGWNETAGGSEGPADWPELSAVGWGLVVAAIVVAALWHKRRRKDSA